MDLNLKTTDTKGLLVALEEVFDCAAISQAKIKEFNEIMDELKSRAHDSKVLNAVKSHETIKVFTDDGNLFEVLVSHILEAENGVNISADKVKELPQSAVVVEDELGKGHA